jgi:hypothetical protein
MCKIVGLILFFTWWGSVWAKPWKIFSRFKMWVFELLRQTEVETNNGYCCDSWGIVLSLKNQISFSSIEVEIKLELTEKSFFPTQDLIVEKGTLIWIRVYWGKIREGLTADYLIGCILWNPVARLGLSIASSAIGTGYLIFTNWGSTPRATLIKKLISWETETEREGSCRYTNWRCVKSNLWHRQEVGHLLPQRFVSLVPHELQQEERVCNWSSHVCEGWTFHQAHQALMGMFYLIHSFSRSWSRSVFQVNPRVGIPVSNYHHNMMIQNTPLSYKEYFDC